MDHVEICSVTKQFIDQLTALGATADINLVFTGLNRILEYNVEN